MITNLDEAIKHCEEVIKEQEENAWEAELQEEYSKIKPCKECAAEHRQLASWLRKLKAYEEADEEICRKMNNGQWSEAVAYGMGKALVIMRKHMREVNANE